MSTPSVPGADPKNLDRLSQGCWAEDASGQSLIFVKGREGGSIVFEIYDLSASPIVFYVDAMMEKEFKSEFSVPPVGKSPDRWTWHDKTEFPWDRVMKRFTATVPQHADVKDQLSVAQRVAERLGIRARTLSEADVEASTPQDRKEGFAIMERIAEALESLRS